MAPIKKKKEKKRKEKRRKERKEKKLDPGRCISKPTFKHLSNSAPRTDQQINRKVFFFFSSHLQNVRSTVSLDRSPERAADGRRIENFCQQGAIWTLRETTNCDDQPEERAAYQTSTERKNRRSWCKQPRCQRRPKISDHLKRKIHLKAIKQVEGLLHLGKHPSEVHKRDLGAGTVHWN